MAASAVNEIESQFARLPREMQLSLLERLVHQLREDMAPGQGNWERELATMAADPDMRKELGRIGSEFIAAEADGLGS